MTFPYRDCETLYASDGWLIIRDRTNPRAVVASPNPVVVER